MVWVGPHWTALEVMMVLSFLFLSLLFLASLLGVSSATTTSFVALSKTSFKSSRLAIRRACACHFPYSRVPFSHGDECFGARSEDNR